MSCSWRRTQSARRCSRHSTRSLRSRVLSGGTLRHRGCDPPPSRGRPACPAGTHTRLGAFAGVLAAGAAVLGLPSYWVAASYLQEGGGGAAEAIGAILAFIATVGL